MWTPYAGAAYPGAATRRRDESHPSSTAVLYPDSVTRAPRAALYAAIGTAALTLSACSGGADPSGATSAPAAPASSEAAATAEAVTTEPSGTAAPKPGSMETPGTSAGPLTRQSFPSPDDLGPDWEYVVDAGDAEEGYSGNGTPALARDPREITLAAVPLGCPRRRLPLPEAALEVDYSLAGTKVIALRAAFSSPAIAERFFATRTEAVRGCLGRTGGAALGPLVGSVEDGDAAGRLVSDRTPESDPWTELALLDGDQVILVAAQGRLGRPPLTPQRIDDMATAFGG